MACLPAAPVRAAVPRVDSCGHLDRVRSVELGPLTDVFVPEGSASLASVYSSLHNFRHFVAARVSFGVHLVSSYCPGFFVQHHLRVTGTRFVGPEAGAWGLYLLFFLGPARGLPASSFVSRVRGAPSIEDIPRQPIYVDVSGLHTLADLVLQSLQSGVCYWWSRPGAASLEHRQRVGGIQHLRAFVTQGFMARSQSCDGIWGIRSLPGSLLAGRVGSTSTVDFPILQGYGVEEGSGGCSSKRSRAPGRKGV
ncbi:hypothetical protein C8R47DRAFT_1084334 [Mycena vitilis]|nr:hypothetical protein C8R47DRAFT_1084334 [Mycena vitilis]